MSSQPGDSGGSGALWGLAGLGVATVALAVLYFLQTRDVALSLAIVALGVGLALVGWVWRDADRLGLPRVPWTIAVLLVPGVGLVGYLVAREVRRSGT